MGLTELQQRADVGVMKRDADANTAWIQVPTTLYYTTLMNYLEYFQSSLARYSTRHTVRLSGRARQSKRLAMASQAYGRAFMKIIYNIYIFIIK